MKKSRQWKYSMVKGMLVICVCLMLVGFGVSYMIFRTSYKKALEEETKDAGWMITGPVWSLIDDYEERIEIFLDEILDCIEMEGLQSGWRYAVTQKEFGDMLRTVWLCSADGQVWDVQSQQKTEKNFFEIARKERGGYEEGRLYMCAAEEGCLFAWKLMDATYKGEKLCIALHLQGDMIKNYVEMMGSGQYRYTYIVDTDGELVYQSKESNPEQLEKDYAWAMAKKNGVYEKDGYLYHILKEGDNFWVISGADLKEWIDAPLASMTEKFFLLFWGITACMVLAGYLLLKHFLRPLKEFALEIKAFTISGEEKECTEEYHITELEELREAFSYMADHNRTLLATIKKEEEVLRKTEQKALQAQIQPHFLYNTLTSIQWLCERNCGKDAAAMTRALGQLFRISLSKGKDLITVRDELQHARSYLIIQEYRYKDQFSWEINAEEEVMDYLCNKITIQPFLENALYHGLEGELEPGKIGIHVYKDDTQLYIEVTDNGVGMSHEKCEKILRGNADDRSGFGVKNVDERIRIYFGKEYGVEMESELDEGTKVTIHLPLIKEMK